MSMQKTQVRRAVALMLTMSAPFAAQNVWAEEPADEAPELVEIIVTAQKRSENIQDVPISVISVSSAELRDAGVKDLHDLTVLTPGLTVSSDATENTSVARIRGIGTVGDNPGLESSVGIVIDGVYRPRNGVGFGNLGELEQIQVLEGPQGELFGKNNDAGVIVVTTKAPSRTFAATAEATYGNFSDREISASVTGPLNDFTAGRIYAGYQRRDGWLKVQDGVGPNTEDSTDSRNVYTLRGQLLFTLSGNMDALFIADYSKRNESCCSAVPRVAGPLEGVLNAVAAIPAVNSQNVSAIGISLTPSQTAYINEPATQQIRDMGVSAEFHWDMGFGKLTSITAWRDNTLTLGNDLDYSGIDILQAPPTDGNQTDFKQFSQELRLAGKEGPLNWLVGAFYAHEALTPNVTIWSGSDFDAFLGGTASAVTGATNFGTVPALTGHTALNQTFLPGVSGYTDSYRQTDNSYAFFTNESYRIIDPLEVTGGLRYTHEAKDAVLNYHNGDGGSACSSLLGSPGLNAPGFNPIEKEILLGFGCSVLFDPAFNNLRVPLSLSESNVSGTVKIAYHITDSVMAYASFADGYKAGGFNLAPVTNPLAANPLAAVTDTSFPDETVDSYEVGFKTTWFNKSLRLDGAVFDQRYKDFQLNTFTGIQFIVTSLPNVSSKGADLTVAWAPPVRGLNITAGATYAFTNIDSFGSALPYFSSARLNDRLSFAPLWSGAAAATYQIPLNSALVFRTTVEEKYNTSYNTGSDLDPLKVQGAFGLMDARLGVGSSDGKWTIEGWATNLLNKFYYQVAFDSTFQLDQVNAFPGQPRFFGITARVTF